jgi:uncharacterized YccA/Bax inhibitor family protein
MANPVLSESRWNETAEQFAGSTTMTVQGTVNKAAILFAVLGVAMAMMWSKYWHGGAPVAAEITPWMIGAGIASVAVLILAMFVKSLIVPCAFLYAAAQGIFLGALTMFIEPRFPGLPLQAACLTGACLLALLMLYTTRIIRPTEGFMRGVLIATGGLMLGMFALTVLGWFGIGGGITAALHGNGMIGIGFSVLCIALAAANLVVDFKVIEDGSRAGAPKRMEWFGAFALMVTLVWLYIEILRLLTKLKSDD